MATNQMRREAAKRKLARQQERRVQQRKRRQRNAIIASVAAVVVVVVVVVLVSMLTGGGGQPVTAEPAAAAVTPAAIPTDIAPPPVRPTPLPATVTCDYPADGQPAAKPVQPPPGAGITTQGTVVASLQTTAGAIPLTLDRALAPCAVNNVVSLAQQGYYSDTPCHRLTTTPELQVLQCGDPTGMGTGGPGYTIPDEVFPELTYGRGVLAMAKTQAPNSGGSQFFLAYGDVQLPAEFTVFGSISPDGLAVLDGVARAGHAADSEAPVQPVAIQSVTVG